LSQFNEQGSAKRYLKEKGKKTARVFQQRKIVTSIKTSLLGGHWGSVILTPTLQSIELGRSIPRVTSPNIK
jgi:hypothetical protein